MDFPSPNDFSMLPTLPLSVRLVVVGLAGTALGGLVNWAIYRLAWNWREISPWGPTPEGARRTWADRIPVFGWLRLRREIALHGRGFWLRPLVIELALGVGLAALYWWEVAQQGLLYRQVQETVIGEFGGPFFPFRPIVSDWLTHAIFLSHVLLIAFMAAASFIDIDEKIIPDEVTVPGTLMGLLLMTLLPQALLPDAAIRENPPIVGEFIGELVEVPGNAALNLYVEPVTLTSPNEWPARFNTWQGLVVGEACWWLWCFALAPRTWRGRRGIAAAAAVIVRRVVREFTRAPLGPIAWVGAAAILAVWWLSHGAWIGLLTSLVGMAVCGGMIWIVRLVGTAALRREAMGFGDVTLMMMIGAYIGWQASVVVFFIAPLPALVIGIVQLVRNDDDVVPYGPSLSLGTLALTVWWATFWSPGLQSLYGVGWLIPAVLVGSFALLGAMLYVWQKIKLALFGAPEEE